MIAKNKIIKIRVNSSAELENSFKDLVAGKVNFIWAENIKCSTNDYMQFQNIMRKIVACKDLLNLSVRLNKIGNKFFLEIKRKGESKLKKYKEIIDFKSFVNEEAFDFFCEDVGNIPQFIIIKGKLYERK
jgi:hypothetical protein